jgi:hypothetical protein
MYKSSIRQKGMSTTRNLEHATNFSSAFSQNPTLLAVRQKKKFEFQSLRRVVFYFFLRALDRDYKLPACLYLHTKVHLRYKRRESLVIRVAIEEFPFVCASRSLTAHGRKEFSFSACTTSAFLPLNREKMMLLLHRARKHTDPHSAPHLDLESEN